MSLSSYISPRLTDSEYGAGKVIARLEGGPLKVEYKEDLHLAVSMRSFRAERVSELGKKEYASLNSLSFAA